MKLPGNIGLKALKKGLSQEQLADLNDVIKSKRALMQEAIHPIEMAVHDFTVAILKGLESVFIANTDEEVRASKTRTGKSSKINHRTRRRKSRTHECDAETLKQN